MTPKELKKLADACRKAGIKHYKDGPIEFTLTDDAPVSKYKKAKTESAPLVANPTVTSDSLTDDQLLFWSVASTDGADETQ